MWLKANVQIQILSTKSIYGITSTLLWLIVGEVILL